MPSCHVGTIVYSFASSCLARFAFCSSCFLMDFSLASLSLPSRVACLPPLTRHDFTPRIGPWRAQGSIFFPQQSVVSQLFVEHGHAQFYETVDIDKNERHTSASNISEDRCDLECTLAHTLSPAGSFPLEQDLLQELASLKLQLKERKRELKARKQALKAEKKLNKVKEHKAKKCAPDTSSSLEESSDSECGCNRVDIRTLGERRSGKREDFPVLATPAFRVVDPSEKAKAICLGAESKDIKFDGKGSEPVEVGDRIEVCMGGKCKRAGSQALLTTLKERIPNGYAASAVGCKCMGRCGMPINVRITKEELNHRLLSHVSIEDDAGLLLKHHSEVGDFPVGLPSLGKKQVNLQPA